MNKRYAGVKKKEGAIAAVEGLRLSKFQLNSKDYRSAITAIFSDLDRLSSLALPSHLSHGTKQHILKTAVDPAQGALHATYRLNPNYSYDDHTDELFGALRTLEVHISAVVQTFAKKNER